MIGPNAAGGLFTNLSSVLDKMKDITENVIPKKTINGIFRAASELLNDADRIEPKTPKKWGDLRGSKKIAITNSLTSGVEIYAGFNISYASAVHERVPLEMYGEKGVNWSEPGSGAKFLETKLVNYGKKYLKMIADSWQI